MSTTPQTASYMLTEDNYLEWQRCLEVSFLKSGCRRVVQDGVPELPEIQETNAHRRLLQLDDLARGLILETIPHTRTDLIDTINSAPDAHSALEELKNLFNSSSAAHLLVLVVGGANSVPWFCLILRLLYPTVPWAEQV